MRYSLKNFVVAAWAALTCLALLGVPPTRADTTYYYTGGPYTISTSFICVGSLCQGGVVPNPNAAADAALFGTNITRSVTFGSDTTGVSGTFVLGQQQPGQITQRYSFFRGT
jgi:hypothetical protein